MSILFIDSEQSTQATDENEKSTVDDKKTEPSEAGQKAIELPASHMLQLTSSHCLSPPQSAAATTAFRELQDLATWRTARPAASRRPSDIDMALALRL